MNAAPLRRGTPAVRAAGVADVAAPVRQVHLGLGAFHRAHQAWYTALAPDAGEWGIAAYTGRRPGAAERLAAQDGLYCLVTRGPDDDAVEVIGSLSATVDGARLDLLRQDLARPEVGVVTLTVTEPAYHLRSDGRVDTDDPAVRYDIDALSGAVGDTEPRTALGRLLSGLDARRRADAGPIAVVPCDNLPSNGTVVRDALLELASSAGAAPLASWLAGDVSVVSTSVDRITPHTPDGPVAAVVDAGWDDAMPVITEPFSDWVLAGAFPSGRPRWDDAGARFVPDIEPWEQRKLWLLNGAHTILAAAGSLLGHTDVAQTAADEVCRDAVVGYWDEAVTLLPGQTDHERYRADLWERFGNRRLQHALAQIATDGRTKVRLRLVAVAERLVSAGRPAAGTANGLAWWLVADAGAAAAARPDDVRRQLRTLSETLADTDTFVAAVHQATVDIAARTGAAQ